MYWQRKVSLTFLCPWQMALEETDPGERRVMGGLSLRAKLYIIAAVLAGIVVTSWQLPDTDWGDLWLFALAILAAIGQVLKVEGTTQRSSYNIAWMAYGFAFVLLGTPAALFVILVAHIVEWAWHKYPWYIQSFNMASYILAIFATGVIFKWVNPGSEPLSLTGTLGILLSLAFFTFLNHLLVGLVIWLARGQNLFQSGVFGIMSLAIDHTLISLGAAAAMLWLINPIAAVVALIPLYLIYNVLRVPALERQSEVDPKTQLYNARYFARAMAKELNRAERFDRPLTVAIGDMDLLRNINNTYGHLAGDVVLCGIAEILQQSFRGYDVVARFGGEEFAILMPETTPAQAFPRMENVRAAIEAAELTVSTSVTPIKVTMSFGIAGREHDGQSASDIIHNADVALYEAKINGRNTTRIYSNESVVALFKLKEPESGHQHMVAPDSSKRISIPFLPNPLREKAASKSTPQEKPSPSAGKPKPAWLLNAYIGILVLIALGLASLLIRPVTALDWSGLAAFALLVILTEGLSVNIYVKDTSVSTSAGPLIAGVLLFGPVGAVVLSVLLAATAWVKKHSPWNRLLFNSSNHLIASLICAGMLSLTNDPIASQPAYIQLSVAITAGMIIYLSSTLLLSGVMSLSLGRPFRQIWKEEFRWLWSYYLAFGVSAFGMILGYNYAGLFGVLSIVVPVLALRFSQIQYIEHTKTMVNQLRSNNVELEKQKQEISALNEELLQSLATIVDMRDPFTLGHSKHVARYAEMIARELGLPPDRIELIRKAGLLHDIGKLGIPEVILFKPGSLTKEEYQVIKKHTTLGAEIVEACHALHPLIPAIRHHHERYDGLGYPEGLLGQGIPLEARIIGLADSLEAMASDRPYRKGLEPREIVEEITKNAGTQFDPNVAGTFLRILRREGESLIVNSGRILARDEPIQVEAFPHLLR